MKELNFGRIKRESASKATNVSEIIDIKNLKVKVNNYVTKLSIIEIEKKKFIDRPPKLRCAIQTPKFKTTVNIQEDTVICESYLQKQPFRCVLKRRCSENMQEIYRRTPMPKCNFNEVALQLHWNCTSTWVFSCKFDGCFQSTFS